MDRLLTPKDIMARYQVCQATAYRYMRSMQHITSPLRVSADAVEAWERDKTQMPVTEEPPRKQKPIRHIQLVDGYRIPRRKEI